MAVSPNKLAEWANPANGFHRPMGLSVLDCSSEQQSRERFEHENAFLKNLWIERNLRTIYKIKKTISEKGGQIIVSYKEHAYLT
jgi:hypothetical protein